MNDRPPISRRKRILRHLADLSFREWGDLAHATFELAVARLRTRSAPIKQILARQEASETQATLAAEHAQLVGRVSQAIPRAAAGVPWRSDCLVQALAAQRWLAARGLPSTITIGVRKESGQLMAHAWLRSANMIVTGGNIAGFDLIFDQTDTLPDLVFG